MYICSMLSSRHFKNRQMSSYMAELESTYSMHRYINVNAAIIRTDFIVLLLNIIANLCNR